MGDLSNTASDIVSGLRVLRGIGGEQVFLDRYRRESQTTRRAGVAVARVQSILDALQVFLPGVFVVVVVWIGARYAVAGRISAGELVAFYGYAAFLMIPLRTATEYANKLIRGRVAARRVCRVLALDPDLPDIADPEPSPPPARRCTTPAPACTSLPACSPRSSPSSPTSRRSWPTASASRPAPPTTRSGSAGCRSPGCGPRRYAAGSWSPTPPRRCSWVASTTGSRSAGPTRRRWPAPCTPRAPRTSSTRSKAVWRGRSRRRAARSPAASVSGWCWPGRC